MAESPPSITVIGVYRVPEHDERLLDELRPFYAQQGSSVEQGVLDTYMKRLSPLVLMEVSAHGVDHRFDVGHFTQEMEGAQEESWQVADAEGLLSPFGLKVIYREQGCADGIGGRIAFYFHYYDPSKPMRWTYGQFSCPPVEPITKPLRGLVPYWPVD